MRSRSILQLVFVLLGLWLIIVFARQVVEFFSSGDRIKLSELDVRKLEEENAKLKAEKDFRNTNFFVEKEAREKLGFGIEGESTVVFKREQSTPEAKPLQDERPNYQKWLDFLF